MSNEMKFAGMIGKYEAIIACVIVDLELDKDPETILKYLRAKQVEMKEEWHKALWHSSENE